MEIDPDTQMVTTIESCQQVVRKVKLRSVADGDDLLMFNVFSHTMRLYGHGFIPNLKGLEATMRDIFKNHPDLMAEFRTDYLRIQDDEDSSSSRAAAARDRKKRKRN